VGFGALLLGLSMTFGSMVFYKIRKGRVMKGASHAKVA
jgi:hypothetical protein